MKLSQLLLDAKMVKSRSEAKRLIEKHAVEIDGEIISYDAEVVFISGRVDSSREEKANA